MSAVLPVGFLSAYLMRMECMRMSGDLGQANVIACFDIVVLHYGMIINNDSVGF